MAKQDLLFEAEQDFGDVGSNTTLNFTHLKGKLKIVSSCTITPGSVPAEVDAAHFQLKVDTGNGGNFCFVQGVRNLPDGPLQIPLAANKIVFVNLYWDGAEWFAQSVSE